MLSQRQKTEPTLLSQFSFSYQKQIIIEFLEDEVLSTRLQNRWKKKRPLENCKIISGKDFLAGKFKREELLAGDHTRIYLIAHGVNNGLRDSYGKAIDLNACIYHLIALIGEHNLIVNLMVCGAGRNMHHKNVFEQSDKSLASLMHKKLSEIAGRDIPVIARRHVIALSALFKMGKIETFKLDRPWPTSRLELFKGGFSLEHRQPGSKAIYCFNHENEEVAVDAYLFMWKHRVIEKLRKHLQRDKNATRVLKLEEFINFIFNLPPNEIYANLQREIHKPTSIFKEVQHIGLFSVVKPSPITKQMERLVSERDDIVGSEFTREFPMLTGKERST